MLVTKVMDGSGSKASADPGGVLWWLTAPRGMNRKKKKKRKKEREREKKRKRKKRKRKTYCNML